MNTYPRSQRRLAPLDPSPDTGARQVRHSFNWPSAYQWAEQQRQRIIYRERVARQQRLIALFCISVVSWAVLWFVGQMIRGVL